MKQITKFITLTLALILVLAGCQVDGSSATPNANDGKISIVATTTMLADLARNIGGDLIEVEGLMGPGIDPHLYKASAGDVTKMQNADLIVYSGLHLEGKMGEIFEDLENANKSIVMIAEGLDEERLIMDEASGTHDPHIWFDVMIWRDASKNLLDGLIQLDSDNEATYQANYDAYIKELDDLDAYVKSRAEELPKEQRVLITAHDAFNYFGNAYDFEVKGLQGISTAAETGTADVKELADFIVNNQIKAVFIESSVPIKNVQALQEAVKSQGFDVAIGGELFSDSLGSPGSEEGTYIGTVKHNINTIVDALK